jgi:uncharacterized protein (DUF697 family)
MVNSFLSTIGKVVRSVDPKDVRAIAERPIHIGLMAPTESRLHEMWHWLAPSEVLESKRSILATMVHPLGPPLPDMPAPPPKLDIELWDASMPTPDHAFTFYADDSERTVREVLDKREDIGLALSRHYLPFRKCVSDRIVSSICAENVLFSVTTALPSIIPLISLPIAIGEFASDTAFLTMNQMRMAFLLAGAHDRPIGYRQQKTQIAGVIAGAFGWRAIARELVGKIPFGGGIVAKAGVSYAGTWVVGRSLERLYRAETKLDRLESNTIYREGIRRGKAMAARLLESATAPAVKK